MATNSINNFLADSPNTNNFDDLLSLLGVLIKEEGVIAGFYIKSTGANNSVAIRWSDALPTSTNQNQTNINKTILGKAVLSLGDIARPIWETGTTERILSFNENTGSSIRFDLVCILQDDVALTTNLVVVEGDIGIDPNLTLLESATKKYLPIGRVRVPASLSVILQNNIDQKGVCNSGDFRAIRPLADGEIGGVKIMTLAERNNGIWESGDFCMVKAALDTNNTLHINVSTTATPFWKQVALLTQNISQWLLSTPQNLGLTPASNSTSNFDLQENQGSPSGGFTFPANFFTVGVKLTINDTHTFSGYLDNSANLSFNTVRNFSINGTLISADRINRVNTSTNTGTTMGRVINLTNNAQNMVCLIECVQVIGNNVQLRIISQTWVNVIDTSNFAVTTNETLITIPNNIPLVTSTNYVTTVSLFNSRSFTKNEVTNFSIQKQT